MQALLHSASRKGKKQATSVTVSPEASSSQLPRVAEEPLSLMIEFQGTTGNYIITRGRDNLPLSIKGGAYWRNTEDARQSLYIIWNGERWSTVEYVNHRWYFVYWNEAKEGFQIYPNDVIENPHLLKLGTETLPYETREEKQSPEEESPQERKTTTSDPDKPVPDPETRGEVSQLAQQLHEVGLEPGPFEDTAQALGYGMAHRIYQEMATVATTMTAPPEITTQAAPQQPPAQQYGEGGGGGGGGDGGGVPGGGIPGGGAPGGGPPGGPLGGPPGGPPAVGAQHILPLPGGAGQGSNGSLQGQPPEKFTGDRKKMKDWIKQL